MKVDLMVFGAHPDDIEIGISGTIAKFTQKRKKVVLVDLTAGEMGSNGNGEVRILESKNASTILGVHERINLNIADRNIEINNENVKKIVEVIRTYKPKIIFYPYEKDYHPDHEMANRLIRESIHSSGLVKFETNQEKHRPKESFCYYINDVYEPSLYIDISDVYSVKLSALKAHESQFAENKNSVSTYLNSGFIENVEIRDKYWGSKCKCSYAELLYSNNLVEFIV